MYVFMIVYDFELQFQLSSYHLLRDVRTSPRTSIHPELRRRLGVAQALVLAPRRAHLLPVLSRKALARRSSDGVSVARGTRRRLFDLLCQIVQPRPRLSEMAAV